MHLDRRLTRHRHISTKNKQLRLKFLLIGNSGLLGRKSRMTLENEILIYKATLKPIWTTGIQLWGSASNSNIEILQRFQNIVWRAMSNAPWYVPNHIIVKDLNVLSVWEEVQRLHKKCTNSLTIYPNELVNNLMDCSSEMRWLKSYRHTQKI